MLDRQTNKLDTILNNFRLEALPIRADLYDIAKGWGVTSIEKRPITSKAMLLPTADGHK